MENCFPTALLLPLARLLELACERAHVLFIIQMLSVQLQNLN